MTSHRPQGHDVHFVFNGDFVDRGDSGVEVLASILSFKILYPKTVHLNRGNHEDENVGRAYGFFDEIITKYGSRAAYDLVGSMYVNIPLCCVIRDKAFIVHAGIPSLPGATILHIGAIGRNAMKATVASQWDVTDDATGKRRQRPGGMRILEDLLWSDPIAPEEAAILDDFQEPNMMRGAGNAPLPSSSSSPSLSERAPSPLPPPCLRKSLSPPPSVIERERDRESKREKSKENPEHMCCMLSRTTRGTTFTVLRAINTHFHLC